MKRVETTEVLFSSLFFLLAIFTLLVVGLSQYAKNFSQLFALVAKERGLYAVLLNLFMTVGFFSTLFFLFRPRARPRLSLRYKISMTGMLFLFFGTLLLGLSVKMGNGSIERESVAGIIDWLYYARQSLARWIGSYWGERALDWLFFFSFVFLPLLIWINEMEFDRNDLLGHYFHSLRPSINLSIGTLFGMSIQPLFKESWWEYNELALLGLGLVLLAILFYKKRHYFGFYEIFNMVLLGMALLLMALAHSLFEGYIDYYEAKKAFYGLVLLGWSARWMDRITR